MIKVVCVICFSSFGYSVVYYLEALFLLVKANLIFLFLLLEITEFEVKVLF